MEKRLRIKNFSFSFYTSELLLLLGALYLMFPNNLSLSWAVDYWFLISSPRAFVEHTRVDYLKPKNGFDEVKLQRAQFLIAQSDRH